jgi:hypothetical protein
VEGIFDYFAFYNLLQDQDKPVVVSTLGSYVTPEAATILKSLDIEHFIVAYDWDELGRNGIERMAAKSNGWVYYLGGLAKDQDPLRYVETGGRRHQRIFPEVLMNNNDVSANALPAWKNWRKTSGGDTHKNLAGAAQGASP